MEELEEIPDVGEIVAQSIYGWFGKKLNQEIIEKLLGVGVKIQYHKRDLGVPKSRLGVKENLM